MNLGLHQSSLTLDWFTPGYWPATAPRLFKLEQNRPAKPDALLVLACWNSSTDYSITPKAGHLMLRSGLLALAICASSTTFASGQQTGDLKITFKLKGDAPKPQRIAVPAGFCAAANLFDESLIVNQQNKGVANVVVHVYTGARRGVQLPPLPVTNKQHTLQSLNCRYEPHVLIAQAGDSLNIINRDPVACIGNLACLKNKPQNLNLPPNQQRTIKLDFAEPAPIPVQCNVRPWLEMWLLVLDHPYAAVSDGNGALIIKDLPAGEKLVFRAFHERGTFKNEIYINGKRDLWKQNRFELRIKPGLNDLGSVEIPATEF
jgi:hypothetical protein